MAQSVHGFLVVDEYFRPGSVLWSYTSMRCGISAKRLIMVSLSKAYSISALPLRTPISDKRVLPIVERRKLFILFIALKDRSAFAEVTGIVTEMQDLVHHA